MIRNLKVLGLALAAVFAISAVVAQAAFGVDTFTSSVSPVGITGTGGGGTKEKPNGVFTITNASGGTISSFHCQTNTYTGTVTNGSSSTTVTPSYHGTVANPASTKCEASLGEIEFDINGCTYTLSGSTTGSDAGKTDATVSINCPTGKEIQITGPLNCVISIPAQTPTSGGVTYDNNSPAAGQVKATATMTGITFTSTSACQFVGIPAEANTTDLNENITIKANSGTLEVSGS